MPKTTFVAGSVVTPEFLNAINNPVYVDPADNDGEFPLITNANLSAAPGQIKSDWLNFRDAFLVRAGQGLTAGYEGGTVRLPDSLQMVTIEPGTVALANNATNIIYLNEAGTIQVAPATSLPVIRLLLASITTVSGAISGEIIDLRHRNLFQIAPRPSAIKIFAGYSNTDYVLNSGTDTLEGDQFFRNFTIEAAGILNINRLAHIRVAGTATIAGSIVVSPAVLGGGYMIANVLAGQIFGGWRGAGPGGSEGEVAAAIYLPRLAVHGSGGSSGYVCNNTGAAAFVDFSRGGSGGGGLIIDVSGTFSISGSIYATGGNGIASPTSIANVLIGGGGGGSGGLIWLKSLNAIFVSPSATLSVAGGSGALGNQGGESGSGGGGGRILLQAPSINTTGSTILLTGGIRQNTIVSAGGGGAGGSFGGLGGNNGGVAKDGSSGVLTVSNFVPID